MLVNERLVLPQRVKEVVAETRLLKLDAGVAIDCRTEIAGPSADGPSHAKRPAHLVLHGMPAEAYLAAQLEERRVEAHTRLTACRRPVTVPEPTGDAVMPSERMKWSWPL